MDLLYKFMEKTCSKCGVSKDEQYFCCDRKQKDGLQSQCKTCKAESVLKYYKQNPERRTKPSKEKMLARYYQNRLAWNFSRRMRRSIGNGKSGRTWESLVGYGLDDLRKHLEVQFVEGMTWDNYGSVWHIDHIVPVSSFQLTSYDSDDFKRCWSLENLQPLFVEDNLRKSDKLNNVC